MPEILSGDFLGGMTCGGLLVLTCLFLLILNRSGRGGIRPRCPTCKR